MGAIGVVIAGAIDVVVMVEGEEFAEARGGGFAGSGREGLRGVSGAGRGRECGGRVKGRPDRAQDRCGMEGQLRIAIVGLSGWGLDEVEGP